MASPFERAFSPAFNQASAAVLKSMDDKRQEALLEKRMLEQRAYDEKMVTGNRAYAQGQQQEQRDFNRMEKVKEEARLLGIPEEELETYMQGQNEYALGLRMDAARLAAESGRMAARDSTMANAYPTDFLQQPPEQQKSFRSERLAMDVSDQAYKQAEERQRKLEQQTFERNKARTEAAFQEDDIVFGAEFSQVPLDFRLPRAQVEKQKADVRAITAFNIKRAEAGLPPVPYSTEPTVQIPRVPSEPAIRVLSPTDYANLKAIEKSVALDDFRKEIDIRAISNGNADAISKATDVISKVEALPQRLREKMASGSTGERANAAREILNYVRQVPIKNIKGETVGHSLVFVRPPELSGGGGGVGGGGVVGGGVGVGGGGVVGGVVEPEFGPQPLTTAAEDAAAEDAAAEKAAAERAAAAEQATAAEKAAAAANAAETVRKQQMDAGIEAKWKAGLKDAQTGSAQRAVIESVIKRDGSKLEDVVGEFSDLAITKNRINHFNSRDELFTARYKYRDAVEAAAIPTQSVSEKARKQEMVTKATQQLKEAKLTVELLDEEYQGIIDNKFTPKTRGSSSKLQPQPTR